MRAMAGNLKGSSPHTRGAHRLRNPWCLRTGIIPAYAGSTKKERMVADEAKDHPRIRGEHVTLGHHVGVGPGIIPAYAGSTRSSTVSGRPSHGSSPHTRGAPLSPGDQSHPNRIIPAYAGSTKSSRNGRFRGLDHPRIRGEHWEAPPDRPIL